VVTSLTRTQEVIVRIPVRAPTVLRLYVVSDRPFRHPPKSYLAVQHVPYTAQSEVLTQMHSAYYLAVAGHGHKIPEYPHTEPTATKHHATSDIDGLRGRL
jgi:hypothetical protein